MAKVFDELRREMSPERRQRNATEAERVLLEMTRGETSKKRSKSQNVQARIKQFRSGRKPGEGE